MDSRRNEIRVGLAVLISIAILVGGIMWGKGYSIRAARYQIEVMFDNVGGLEPGANVLANGVVKGKVLRIVLEEGKVRVRAAVDKSVILYSNYRITVESPTVMAGKALSIYPGERGPMADISQPLRGEPPVGVGEAVTMFENISADLQTTMANLNTLLVNLNKIAGDTANQQNLAGLLLNANGVAKTSNEWLSQNRDLLTNTVTKLDQTVAALQDLVGNTETRLATTFGRVDSVAATIGQLSESAHALLEQAGSKEGTVGRLLNDDEFYRHLNKTLSEADSLIQQIRAKGLKTKVSIF